MGESGSGKTTAMRTLNPDETYYIDCDGKGLSWKGWREQYNADKKNYIKTDDQDKVLRLMRLSRIYLYKSACGRVGRDFVRNLSSR